MEILFPVRDVRVSPALTFEEMSRNSKRYLATSGEWELVDILGETSILQFGIDEWDIITFWVTTDLSYAAPEHILNQTLNFELCFTQTRRLFSRWLSSGVLSSTWSTC